MLKDYYRLTKPGIVRGNLITAAAGFLFASGTNINLGLFLASMLGISLLIASACVINNVIDQGVDAHMERTRKRALVTGQIRPKQALMFGAVLGVTSFLLLGLKVNAVTVALGLVAFLDYVVLYGWSKRKGTYGTLVGSIAGALPITAGYTAAAGSLDLAAVLLFFILVSWQMPHFYAIAIFRAREYKAAKIPILPLVKGNDRTKIHMFVYGIAFTILVAGLYFGGYAGLTYLAVMLATCLYWLLVIWQGFHVSNDIRWAQQVFRTSLLVLLILSVMLSLEAILP